MKITSRHILFTGILVILATACKYFFGPNLEWSGFSPVIAIALFSGFIMKQKDMSFVLPFVALLLSDVFIQFLYSVNLFPYAGFYSSQWINYSILLASTLIGWMLKGRSITSLATGAVAAPTAYFLISNLSVWSSNTQTTYPKTFAGLLTCYEAALPFYRNSIIATLVFLPIILISYNYITKHKTELTLA
jgi:hypothetical protein